MLLAFAAIVLVVANSTGVLAKIQATAEQQIAVAEEQINTLGGKVLDTASTLADNSAGVETATPMPIVVLAEPSLQGQDVRLAALAQETQAAEIVVAPTTVGTATNTVSLTVPISAQAVALADTALVTATETAATAEPTAESQPTATPAPTDTPLPTDTPVPTNTPVPISTRPRMKDVPASIAATPIPPTPTATLAAPTPTTTPLPPTPTATPLPPTATPLPPTPTATPLPPAREAEAAAADTTASTYVVEPGDNWYNIARRYGITQETLAAANGKTPFDILQVDDKLLIPSAVATATRTNSAPLKATSAAQATAIPTPQSYVVQRGDNWFTIAKRFGITQEALAYFNNQTPADILQVNQKLRIPPAGVPVAKPTSTPVAPTPTAKPASTPTPEPTAEPIVARLAAPVLLSPLTGDGFTSDTLPMLTWQPVAGVTDQDFYYVRVNFTTNDGEAGFLPGEVTGTSYTIPRWVFDAAQGPDRYTSWSVQVVRHSSTGDSIQVSPPSETRTFYWR